MYPHYDPTCTYRILGIDPGTNTLGTSWLDLNLATKQLTVAGAKTYVGNSMATEYRSFGDVHGGRAARLKAHEDNLFHLMYEWRPHSVVCESSFMGRFPQAYMALVECIESVRMALWRYNPALPLLMVDPITVKKSTGITGAFRGRNRIRGKEPIKEALSELSYLQYAPGVHLSVMDEHSIDAVAVAHWRACQLL